ncbi:Uncharacterised protein [Kingella potus]|uniref:Uncharacterized protein n=1 Tax=Kingella potus TaxID=265175 RepID=A0A377R3Z6_9NEIS|nr:hypothetical protein [Kingella potus]UOP00603.1 hypothetical protein LVJ84_12390 [Kingella potus]STR02999.1 Uncharacterised protein [Kingella potus]
MSEHNTPSGKKKSFLTAGKLLWAFVFLLSVAVAALLINVWLELQRPPAPPPAASEPKTDKIEVLSPSGAPPPATGNGNPLVPQRPQEADNPPEEAASAAAAPAKPKAKAKPKEDVPKEEKMTPQETVLEPVNKQKNNSERTLEPVNKTAPAGERPLTPKTDKPARRQSGGDMDNLF